MSRHLSLEAFSSFNYGDLLVLKGELSWYPPSMDFKNIETELVFFYSSSTNIKIGSYPTIFVRPFYPQQKHPKHPDLRLSGFASRHYSIDMLSEVELYDFDRHLEANQSLKTLLTQNFKEYLTHKHFDIRKLAKRYAKHVSTT